MHYFPDEMRETEHIAWVWNHFEVDCSKLFLSSEDESKTCWNFVWPFSHKNQSLKLLDLQSFGFIFQMN